MSTVRHKIGEEQRQPSQEYLLLDYTQRLARHREGRRAVRIHLSRLKSYNRRDHHIRIAVNTFENLVKQFEGQIFPLSNQDIVFLCKGARVEAIDEAVTRLRYLFADDPLAQEPAEEDGGGAFCTWYDVERRYDDFLAAVRQLHDEEVKRTKRLAAILGNSAPGGEDRARMDGHRLGELVDAIQRADLSNIMRRQPVAAIAAAAEPQVIFRELYISIPDLGELILPGYEIAGDRWLFQHLTRTLDRRMLKLLVKNDDRAISHSFSINVNVATLLSDEFLEFDASLRSGARGTIVLELQLIDAFADLNSFAFAREFVKERGYRLCLDGVDHNTLPFVDRERLGLDLIKLAWRQDMLDQNHGERAEQLRAQVERLGKTRAILCHCDSEAAVQFGQSCGVNLFQGRHVDKLLGRRGSLAGLRTLSPPR